MFNERTGPFSDQMDSSLTHLTDSHTLPVSDVPVGASLLWAFLLAAAHNLSDSDHEAAQVGLQQAVPETTTMMSEERFFLKYPTLSPRKRVTTPAGVLTVLYPPRSSPPPAETTRALPLPFTSPKTTPALPLFRPETATLFPELLLSGIRQERSEAGLEGRLAHLLRAVPYHSSWLSDAPPSPPLRASHSDTSKAVPESSESGGSRIPRPKAASPSTAAPSSTTPDPMQNDATHTLTTTISGLPGGLVTPTPTEWLGSITNTPPDNHSEQLHVKTLEQSSQEASGGRVTGAGGSAPLHGLTRLTARLTHGGEGDATQVVGNTVMFLGNGKLLPEPSTLARKLPEPGDSEGLPELFTGSPAAPELSLEPLEEPEPLPEQSPAPEPSATPEPSSKPSPVSEPSPLESSKEPGHSSKPSMEPEPSAAPEPSKPSVEPEPSSEPLVEPEPSLDLSFNPSVKPEPSPEPSAEPEPLPEPSAESKPSLEPLAAPGPLPKPSAEPEPSPEPSVEPESLPQESSTEPEPSREPSATSEPLLVQKPSAEPSAAPELSSNLLEPLIALLVPTKSFDSNTGEPDLKEKPFTATSTEPAEPFGGGSGSVAPLTGSSSTQELDTDEETLTSSPTQPLNGTAGPQKTPGGDCSHVPAAHTPQSPINIPPETYKVISPSDANETANETTEEELLAASRAGGIKWTTFKAVMFVVQFVIMVETVIGNLMVILSVKMEKRLQTPFNYYIVNLAFTDMNVGLSVMSLFMIYNLYDYFPFAAPLCHYWIWSDYTMTFESVMTLAAISVDRLWSVTWSLHYRNHNSGRKSLYIILGTWFLVALIWLPPFLYDRAVHVYPEGDCNWDTVLNKNLVVYVGITGYYTPLLVMLGAYARILWVVRKRAASIRDAGRKPSIQADPSSGGGGGGGGGDQKRLVAGAAATAANQAKDDKQEAKLKREMKAVYTLLNIVVIFLLCWVPFYILFVLSAWFPTLFPTWYVTFSYWMAYINSAVNPVLYPLSSPEFRQAYKKVVLTLIGRG